eukprot:jgi/Botrbrau1/16449/Bobra.0142s0045.1
MGPRRTDLRAPRSKLEGAGDMAFSRGRSREEDRSGAEEEDKEHHGHIQGAVRGRGAQGAGAGASVPEEAGPPGRREAGPRGESQGPGEATPGASPLQAHESGFAPHGPRGDRGGWPDIGPQEVRVIAGGPRPFYSGHFGRRVKAIGYPGTVGCVLCGPSRWLHTPHQGGVANSGPVWNETFVVPAEDIAGVPARDRPGIVFEVWDSDGYMRDVFLGQVDLLWSAIPKSSLQAGPVTLSLYAQKRGKRYEGQLGVLQVATWLGPKGVTARMQEGQGEGCGCKSLSTLCVPPGVGKRLPLVVHSGGNTLFEEPCLQYLNLFLSEIRELDVPELPSRTMLSFPHFRGWRDTSFMSRPEVIRETLLEDTVEDVAPPMCPPNRSPSAMQLQLQQGDEEVTWLEEAENDTEEDEEEEEEEDEDDNDSRWGTSNDASSRQDTGPRGTLYWEVMWGTQKRTSKSAAWQEGRARWAEDLAFVSALPLKPRPFKLVLFYKPSRRSPPRAVARAFIPLPDLLPPEDPGPRAPSGGSWYRLHPAGSRQPREGEGCGIVRLKLTPIDADCRRQMYGQPLMEPAQASGSSSEPQSITGTTTTSDELSTASCPRKDSSLRSGTSVECTSAVRKPSAEPTTCTSGLTCSAGSTMWERTASQDGVQFPEELQSATSNFSSGSAFSGPSALTPFQALSATTVDEEWGSDTASPCNGPSRSASGLLHSASGLMRSASGMSRANSAMRRNGSRLLAIGKSWMEKQDSGVMMYLGHTPTPSRAPSVHRPQPWRKLLQYKTQMQGPAAKHANPPRPLGLVKLLLQSVEMASCDSWFCLLQAGPNWGRTCSVTASNPQWNWEVHLPLYDPATVLLLGVYKAGNKRRSLRTSEPLLAGKLRLRFSTVQAGEAREARLPLAGIGKHSADIVGFVNIRIEVIYFDVGTVCGSYVKAPLPLAVYAYGLQHDTLLHKFANAIRERSLLASSTGITPALANSLLDGHRRHFTFARAKQNLRRLRACLRPLRAALALFRALQRWEHPLASLGAVGVCLLGAVLPSFVAAAALLLVVVACTAHYPQQSRPLLEMEVGGSNSASEDEENATTSGSPYAVLKERYDRLLRVALKVQNVLDDMATTLERGGSFFTWVDPLATSLFVSACLLLALLIHSLPLSYIIAGGLCWSLRPPFLRTPSPPAPLLFFQRLPSRADQIL